MKCTKEDVRTMRQLRFALAFLTAVVISLSAFTVRADEVEQPQTITFDQLKFAHKTGEPFKRAMLGEKIEALNGKTAAIRGWILPSFQIKVEKFVLVRDIDLMNFGPGLPLCEVMMVEMKTGETAQYSTKPVSVQGTFSIREFKVDGTVHAVYHIQAAKVIAVKKAVGLGEQK